MKTAKQKIKLAIEKVKSKAQKTRIMPKPIEKVDYTKLVPEVQAQTIKSIPAMPKIKQQPGVIDTRQKASWTDMIKAQRQKQFEKIKDKEVERRTKQLTKEKDSAIYKSRIRGEALEILRKQGFNVKEKQTQEITERKKKLIKEKQSLIAQNRIKEEALRLLKKRGFTAEPKEKSIEKIVPEQPMTNFFKQRAREIKKAKLPEDITETHEKDAIFVEEIKKIQAKKINRAKQNMDTIKKIYNIDKINDVKPEEVFESPAKYKKLTVKNIKKNMLKELKEVFDDGKNNWDFEP